jgi:hypothetical protein
MAEFCYASEPEFSISMEIDVTQVLVYTCVFIIFFSPSLLEVIEEGRMVSPCLGTYRRGVVLASFYRVKYSDDKLVSKQIFANKMLANLADSRFSVAP